MNYTIKDIAGIVNGNFLINFTPDCQIKDISIDSRSSLISPACIFIAIVGNRNNGHDYISDLYDKGLRNFIVSQVPKTISDYKGANIIQVVDTLKALQKLAASHRSKFNIPIIGITGSNGKTIVKEWLFQLLSHDKRVIRSPKSYNSQVGVPLSVWQMQDEHELAIFEAGISEPDEMEKLQPIIRPTIGIFTNIGAAHEKNFITRKQKVGEKLKLFTKVDTLIYCSDYFEIQDIIIKSEILQKNNFFSWSYSRDANLKIIHTEKKLRRTTITAEYDKKKLSIIIPFADEASIENAIHCWAVMLYFKYSNEDIANRFMQLTPVAMRLELKEGINNCSVINDSYNSDIKSLAIAIDFLNQQKQHKRKTVILSDILQSAQHDDDLYSELAVLLKEKGITRLIGIGENIKKQAHKFEVEKNFYSSTEEFIKQYNLSSFQNESILIKGARVFEFEQISRVLQQKSHETVLEINLNAVVNNLNYFRAKLNPETKIMAMVKAFSYGSGSYEIANVLQFNHVDYLSVAYADEGVELRKAGITTPIMVMNTDEQSFEKVLNFNLEPEIYSFRILGLYVEYLKSCSPVSNKKINIHIKLDTGMHRLGFEVSEISQLIKVLKQEKQIKVRSVFSHLAAADEVSHDDFTKYQIDQFQKAALRLKNELDNDILLHILNSAGISRFSGYQFDMVRLGIGLYGISSLENEQPMLQNVGTLKSIITQIKEIPKDDSVGYSRKWKASVPSTIAVVPVGYADGLDRRLGNGIGKVIINGHIAPITGNICMDMCMIDITGIKAQEGDEVIIFSDSLSVKELAIALGTIPYEVLTSISRRVKRIYYYE